MKNFFIILSIIFLSGCVNNQALIKENQNTILMNNNVNISQTQSANTNTTYVQQEPDAPKATVITPVIDSKTKQPVIEATVYVGTGFYTCLTDLLGKCTINLPSYGEYGLSVYKKGYNRYFAHDKFVGGENTRLVELEKLAVAPVSFTLSGTVIEIITALGTRSENHYFKLKQANGREDYIFNRLGYNNSGDNAFKDYINKNVTLTGYKGQGFIGWQGEEVEGIYMEKINLQ